MASDDTLKAIVQALMAAPSGLANGARAFGDQAKWMMGGYGNAPMPAPYDGGPAYPAANDANAYVRNNYPMASIAVIPQSGRPDGWGAQQPQIVQQPIQGPYDLMQARSPEEQALRDRSFPH